MIFRLTEDGVIIATNRHVLDYWQEDVGVIRFPQGFYVSAQVLGSAEDCDVGFLKVENSELGMETLLTLRNAAMDEEVCRRLAAGKKLFVWGRTGKRMRLSIRRLWWRRRRGILKPLAARCFIYRDLRRRACLAAVFLTVMGI